MIQEEIVKLFRIKADIKSILISKCRSPDDDFTIYTNEIKVIVCNDSRNNVFMFMIYKIFYIFLIIL